MNKIFSLKQFGISQSYKRVRKLGDRLERISGLVDWERFKKFFEKEYITGRPSYDPILMLKMLVLQSWYSISDQELEYQIADRISFQKFLGFPNEIPDYSTLWRFREALAENDTIHDVWEELKRQMQENGIKLSKGHIQDASIVVANPGKTNSGMKDRGRNQPTTRNEDGSWTKKGNKSYFGYKDHIKVDASNGIVTDVAVTTASTHDSTIDLSKPHEIVYRDKGYYGAKPKAKGDATMKRATRGHPLSIRDKLRNKRISRKRAPGERPFAVVKRVMKGGCTYLTELHRVFVQSTMRYFTYNLIQMNRVLGT
jgi:IS5 family transposase